jgi:hypothetical protein
MHRRTTSPVAASVAVLLAIALLFAACGNSTGSPERRIVTGPLRIVGGGIGPFREPGADNNLVEYGHEASRAELRQAATTVHAYLVAWAEKDWRKACALASRALKENLTFVFKSSGKASIRRCESMMSMIAGGEAPLADGSYRATEVNAGSLRIGDGRGFLLFTTAGRQHQIEVIREGSFWRVKGTFPASVH